MNNNIEAVTCTTPSIISTNIVIVYGSIYSLFLSIVSGYSFKSLHKNPEFSKKSYCRQFKGWLLDLKRRRSCYIPILAHLFDQLTDISVSVQFFQLAQTKSDNNWIACNGLNIWVMFGLSILTLVVYRLITAYLIYQYTESVARCLSQLLDLELFQSLYVNYLCDITEPCNPQRWLTAMEAALESTPQALIQTIYLIKTGGFEVSNTIFLISLISSLWNIISKLIADDKQIVVEDAKNLSFKFRRYVLFDIFIGLFAFIFCIILCLICCPCWIFYAFIKICCYEGEYVPNSELNLDVKEMMKFEPNVQRNSCADFFRLTRSFSWTFILRVAWRIIDVSSRLFMMVLIWLVIGGWTLSIIIAFEFVFFLMLSVITNHWELITGIVTLVVSMTEKTKAISAFIFVYRAVSNFVLIIMISIWLFTDFDCPKCTNSEERETFSQSGSTIYVIFIFCWFGIVLSPLIVSILIQYQIFVDGATTSRDLQQMITANNVNGILEIQLYSAKYGIYDKKNNKSLLELAIDTKKGAIASYLLNKQTTIIPDDILDCYIEQPFLFSKKALLSIYRKHPTFTDKAGKYMLYCALSVADRDGVDAMLKIDHKFITSKDVNDRNVLDHYVQNQSCCYDSSLLYISKLAPFFIDRMGRNTFLVAAATNNTDVVHAIIRNNVKDEILFTDMHEKNILDYYMENDLLREYLSLELASIYRLDPHFTDIQGRNAFLVAAVTDNTDVVHEIICNDENALLSTNSNMHNPFNHNILDHYVRNKLLLTDNELASIYRLDPQLTDKKGRNAFFVAAATDNTDVVHEIIRNNENALLCTDMHKQNILDHYVRNKSLLTDDELASIYGLDQKFTDTQGRNAFLVAAAADNTDVVHEIISKNENALLCTDIHNQNILDHYVRNKSLLTDNELAIIYRLGPQLTDKKGRNAFLVAAATNNSDVVHEIICNDENVLLCTNINMHKQNILDHYVRNKSLLTDNELMSIYGLDQQFTDTQGRNAFLVAATTDNTDVVHEIIRKNENALLCTDIRNQNILDHYVRNNSLLTNNELLSICRLDPQLTETDGRNVFLVAALSDNTDVVHEIISNYENMLLCKDKHNETILDYYARNESLLKDKELVNIYRLHPQLTDKKGRNVFLAAATYSNIDVIDELIRVCSISELAASTDSNNEDIMDYYSRNRFKKCLSNQAWIQLFPVVKHRKNEEQRVQHVASRLQQLQDADCKVNNCDCKMFSPSQRSVWLCDCNHLDRQHGVERISVLFPT